MLCHKLFISVPNNKLQCFPCKLIPLESNTLFYSFLTRFYAEIKGFFIDVPHLPSSRPQHLQNGTPLIMPLNLWKRKKSPTEKNQMNREIVHVRWFYISAKTCRMIRALCVGALLGWQSQFDTKSQITVICSQNIMLDDNTIRLSLFRPHGTPSLVTVHTDIVWLYTHSYLDIYTHIYYILYTISNVICV